MSSIPGQGTKILDASWPKKKKKKNQNQKDNAVALITVTTVCTHHTIPEFVHHPRKNRCTH